MRLSPVACRDRYAADFSPSLSAAAALSSHPAVGPLRWNEALNRSARAHSADMGVNGCFQHDSCDGTTWNARIASHHTLSGVIGENIAAGYPAPADPRYAMSMWLCDAPAVPLVDGSHVLFPAGRVTFLANFVDAGAPRSVKPVLSGSDLAMGLDLGAAASGTYAAGVAVGAACRAYHFVAVDSAGVSWRYPASGEFQTYGEGNCADDWTP